MAWTFAGGTFHGIVTGKWVGPPSNQPPTAYRGSGLYGVLQGTGIFAGKVAIFEGSKPAGQPFSVHGEIITT